MLIIGTLDNFRLYSWAICQFSKLLSWSILQTSVFLFGVNKKNYLDKLLDVQKCKCWSKYTTHLKMQLFCKTKKTKKKTKNKLFFKTWAFLTLFQYFALSDLLTWQIPLYLIFSCNWNLFCYLSCKLEICERSMLNEALK